MTEYRLAEINLENGEVDENMPFSKGDRVKYSASWKGTRNLRRIGVVYDTYKVPAGFVWVHVLWDGLTEVIRYYRPEELQKAEPYEESFCDPIPDPAFTRGDTVKRNPKNKERVLKPEVMTRRGKVTGAKWNVAIDKWYYNVKWEGRKTTEVCGDWMLIKPFEYQEEQKEIPVTKYTPSPKTIYVQAKELWINGVITEKEYMSVVTAPETLVDTIAKVLEKLK